MNGHFVETGTGLPFIFQHGLGGALAQAQGLMHDLPDVRLISLDVSGHGQTPLGAAVTPSFERYADEVIALMDHLGLETALLGGISMGSGIALNAAIRFPERVSGLVLVRPAWLNRPNPSSLDLLLAVANHLERGYGSGDFEQYPPFQALKAKLPMAAESTLGQFSREQGEHTSRIFRAMIGDVPFAHMSHLMNLQMPALVLASGHDLMHPLAFGTAIAEALPQGRFQEIPSRYLNGPAYEAAVRGLTRGFIQGAF